MMTSTNEFPALSPPTRRSFCAHKRSRSRDLNRGHSQPLSGPGSATSDQALAPGLGNDGHNQQEHNQLYNHNYDKTDFIPDDLTFTWIDILATLFSIGSFLFDIGTDCVVAAFHYYRGDYWYFGLTTAFIIIPTLVMTGISMRWYVLDSRIEGAPPVSPLKWALRFIFLLLQLGPILRYVDSLIYGLKFLQSKQNVRERRKYHEYMVYEDTDATMLRLFECFMEAAPQLVLQLYILIHSWPHSPSNYWLLLSQLAAVATSLISLSWSLVSYHRSLRMSLRDKLNMSWQGVVVQFLWRIHVIASRVAALALFASQFTWHIFVVCAIHWLAMFAWIVSMQTSFCDNRCEELGYNAVLAVMYIFCYFNPVDSPTRYRYLTFYSFMFVENTILLALWYSRADQLWYRIPALITHYIFFATGIVFMCLYYLYLHPTKKIRIFPSRSRSPARDPAVEEYRRVQANISREEDMANGVWTTQGRVLHPRPAVAVSFSDITRIANVTVTHQGSKEGETSTPPKETAPLNTDK